MQLIQLIHGDAKATLPTLADASIDCIVTDPPYGHKNNDGDLIAVREAVTASKSKKKKGFAAEADDFDVGAVVTNGKPRPIANDGSEANDLFKWCLPQYKRLLKPGCCCCCCCGGGGGIKPQFARWSLWTDKVLEFKQLVVWDKGPIGMGWHYRRSYETVIVSMKPGGPCKWYDDTGKIENVIRPGQYGIKKIIPGIADHPCEKPVELAELFIRLHTKKGDTVLDPFMGRGWVGAACRKMGRNFIGIEIDEHWYKTAKARIESPPAYTTETFGK